MGQDRTVERVAERIERTGISLREAARAIGVTEDSLRRHLRGDYARSDSLAKYRLWLGRSPDSACPSQLELIDVKDRPRPDRGLEALRLAVLERPEVPYRVVDIFCGCGGLSLGFDLVEGGEYFETVLAVDIEEAMVETFNRNHPGTAKGVVGRTVDLADFLNETEVRAFYLDHIASLELDWELASVLEDIRPVGLPRIKQSIQRLDARFLQWLEDFRREPSFVQAYSAVDSRSLSQTSVLGFHQALKLPPLSAREFNPGSLLWAGGDLGPENPEEDFDQRFREHWLHVEVTVRRALEGLWEATVLQLTRKGQGSGRGQLAASAPRIREFLDFLQEMDPLRKAWVDWRSRRDSLRFAFFGHPEVEHSMLRAYSEERRVFVLLGGPPCQGFSRIGRGKIRSLRDHHVQVHYDEGAGDQRNRLFEKYVLFLEALAPSVFLFENVRHFQTEVRTPEGTFLATELLAEAVRSLSEDGLNYEVSSRTVAAAEHGVPQSRERFFMVGVRKDLAQAAPHVKVPDWVLSLPRTEAVPLRIALEELPAPFLVEGPSGGNLSRSFTCRVSQGHLGGRSACEDLRAWLRQPSPARRGDALIEVDAHVARNHRSDDQAWFAIMGPGTRWMDYRCDHSPTLQTLRKAVQAALTALDSSSLRNCEQALTDELKEALGLLDGSLTLRLLLEEVGTLPGELEHHLAKPTYLRKREGNHGDWLARLDGERPSRTIVTHMGKDTYAYIHPWRSGSLSVREAARIQTFPDWFSFGNLGLVDGFRVVGNAVPPLLSFRFAERIAELTALSGCQPSLSHETAIAG